MHLALMSALSGSAQFSGLELKYNQDLDVSFSLTETLSLGSEVYGPTII